MIYLDNAATGGIKPNSVVSAVQAALKFCANPGRSGHKLSLAASERALACRNRLSDLFSGYGFERVIFTKNCTEALNIALLGTLKEGDHVIATALEHNSVLRPLDFLKQKGIIEYSIAPLTNGKVLPESVAALVKENTRLCAVTTASNVTGTIPDLAAIRALLPERVLLLADGAQGAGHIPISMKETGIDLLALAGHKGLHAIQGAGALLFSERVNPAPLLFGGTGSESYSLSMPEFYPDRLESGTLSYPAVVSLFEGAIIAKCRLKEHGATLTKLSGAFLNGLRECKGFVAYSEPNPCGIVAFRHETLPSEEIAMQLDERGICVRGGLQCAPLAHKALGTFPDGLVRVSFSPFQSLREIRETLRTLKFISISI